MEGIFKDSLPNCRIQVTETVQVTVIALVFPSGDRGIEMDLDSSNSDDEL